MHTVCFSAQDVLLYSMTLTTETTKTLIEEKLENGQIVSLTRFTDELTSTHKFVVAFTGRNENWTETVDTEEEGGDLVANILFDDLCDLTM